MAWLHHIVDAFDNWVLGHRFYWVCQLAAKIDYPTTHDCWYCRYWKAKY